MITESFNSLVSDRTEKIIAILGAKAIEYARGDRLSNFKSAASFLGCTPERALQGMRIKHEVSVRDMVNDIDRGIVWPLEKWEEKLGDSINYLILLEGLILERLSNMEAPAEKAVREIPHAKPRRR